MAKKGTDSVGLVRCEACGAVQAPTHVRCRACGRDALAPFDCPLVGHVVTFTNCAALPRELADREKVTFAVVQLDCGARVLCLVEPEGTVVVGSPVEGEASPDGVLTFRTTGSGKVG
ncbi:MAG: hypothetical protein Kow0069_19390 [Promethearchaeota archaeon]